jgi:uncharacterized protein (DUF1330 family)
MPIDLGSADLSRLRESDDGRPFVLAQFLRYGLGGREQYLAYSRAAQALMRGLGASIVSAGECHDRLGTREERSWDVILLVRYPSRSAYVEMISSPAFQELAELRRKALRDADFVLVDDWPGR